MLIFNTTKCTDCSIRVNWLLVEWQHETKHLGEGLPCPLLFYIAVFHFKQSRLAIVTIKHKLLEFAPIMPVICSLLFYYSSNFVGKINIFLPIMIIKLPIIFLSNAPKFSLSCPNYTLLYFMKLLICDWIYENRPYWHKKWNPIYCWLLNLHSCTT